MEAWLVVVRGGGQQRIDFGDGDNRDPKKWTRCRRLECRAWMRRKAKCHEARGQGRYCCRRCGKLDYWAKRKRQGAQRTAPIEEGQGRPTNDEQDSAAPGMTPEPMLKAIAGGRKS